MSDFPHGEWNPARSKAMLAKLFQDSSSPVPFIVRRARGAFLYDTDGYKYVDFCLSNGEVVLGHKPARFQYLKNQLNRTCFGSQLSLIHYHMEKSVKQWLEQQKIVFHSVRFFDTVGEAFFFLQAVLGFSSMQSHTWSLHMPPFAKSVNADVVFFETLNEQLEPFPLPAMGRLILVENACLGRLSAGLSLREGWDFALVGPVVSNGLGGCMLVSKDVALPPTSPIRLALAAAIHTTITSLAEFPKAFVWPALPPSILQRGGLFRLPSDIQAERLLPHGIFVKKTGFLSYSHTENEIRRLVNGIEAQGASSTTKEIPPSRD